MEWRRLKGETDPGDGCFVRTACAGLDSASEVPRFVRQQARHSLEDLLVLRLDSTTALRGCLGAVWMRMVVREGQVDFVQDQVSPRSQYEHQLAPRPPLGFTQYPKSNW